MDRTRRPEDLSWTGGGGRWSICTTRCRRCWSYCSYAGQGLLLRWSSRLSHDRGLEHSDPAGVLEELAGVYFPGTD
ncbi:hypothetical protein IG631_09664 [Alternaria alternata]|nr:hypothetical protein IG631_09664 [Alternaria alternata]